MFASKLWVRWVSVPTCFDYQHETRIRTRGKFTATNMRGADYAGDARKGHPFPLNIFLSSSPDTQIPTVIRVQVWSRITVVFVTILVNSHFRINFEDGGATLSSPSVDQEGFCYQAAKNIKHKDSVKQVVLMHKRSREWGWLHILEFLQAVSTLLDDWISNNRT